MYLVLRISKSICYWNCIIIGQEIFLRSCCTLSLLTGTHPSGREAAVCFWGREGAGRMAGALSLLAVVGRIVRLVDVRCLDGVVVAGYLLLVAGYWLLVIGCWMSCVLILATCVWLLGFASPPASARNDGGLVVMTAAREVFSLG